MMRAVPRMANMRAASIKSQTVRAVSNKLSGDSPLESECCLFIDPRDLIVL